MTNTKKAITVLLAGLVMVSSAFAQDATEGFVAETAATTETMSPVVLQNDSSAIKRKRVTFKRNRIDREINKNKFVHKGETILGITASYGTISSEDSDLALILDKINLKGSIVSVKPHAGYCYRDNMCVGVRLGYSHMFGDLGNLTLDLGETNDIAVSIGNMRYMGNTYTVGVYHRMYMALDPRGRFGVFGELELSGSAGRTEFGYKSGETWKSSVSDIYKCDFSFNPGVAVYIFPNVCGSISFGLGGLRFVHTRQYDENNNLSGKRNYSKMRFRLNLADINVGVTIHLWNKKKDAALK